MLSEWLEMSVQDMSTGLKVKMIKTFLLSVYLLTVRKRHLLTLRKTGLENTTQNSNVVGHMQSNVFMAAKVLNLKKKLLEQILVAAEDLGDPADPETGWDVHFKRVKTGPMAYNVEYQLQALKCKQRALDESEMELIKDLKSMDDVLPRPTPDAQLELLKRIQGAESNETVDEEFDVS